MTRPRLPGIEPRTPEEKAAAERYQQARDAYYGVQSRLAARTSDDDAASAYDLVADALFHAMSDQLYAAIASPDFAYRLQQRGLRVGPALDEGDPPAPPAEWAMTVLEFSDPDSELVEPIELIDRLYAEAWQAGWEAHAAAPPPEDEGEVLGDDR